MVEGLAGVVDKSIQFKEVEISPRWYFAGVEKTTVKIGYGNNGNHLIYEYDFNPKNNQVSITTSGKFERFTLRIPFPEKAKSVTASINQKKVKVTLENVNTSRYAVVTGEGSNNAVVFRFK